MSDDREAAILRAVSDLNMDYVQTCGEYIREGLLAGRAVGIDYQPGDGTRYELVFTPCAKVKTVPNIHGAFHVPDGFGESYGTAVLVSQINGKSKAWALDLIGRTDWLAPWYVEPKFETSHDSAVALIALFAAIAGNDKVLYGR